MEKHKIYDFSSVKDTYIKWCNSLNLNDSRLTGVNFFSKNDEENNKISFSFNTFNVEFSYELIKDLDCAHDINTIDEVYQASLNEYIDMKTKGLVK